MSDTLTKDTLRRLVGEWLKEGRRVIGPVQVKPDLVLYQAVQSPDSILFDGFIHPGNAIKEFFFPRSEPIYSYTLAGADVKLDDIDPPGTPQVILAARPCDAAFAPILDRVFNWDYKDKFYNVRREVTTIVSLACTEFDSQCFCTSVGITPESTQGADSLLVPAGEGRYEVRILTDKGRKLFDGKTETASITGNASPGPQVRFDVQKASAFIRDNFEHPLWNEIALRCLGCGACAYTCPTCHCFDIVDEGNAAGGRRVKNWDCCQFAPFTMHASGHNPRSSQGQRQRQRLLHKFFIYPDKFNEILCTGCGDCTRNCPVGLGVLTAMMQIQQTTANEVSK